jgi:signal transduction histidine kinase
MKPNQRKFGEALLIRCFVMPVAVFLFVLLVLNLWLRYRLISQGMAPEDVLSITNEVGHVWLWTSLTFGPLMGFLSLMGNLGRRRKRDQLLSKLGDWRPGEDPDFEENFRHFLTHEQAWDALDLFIWDIVRRGERVAVKQGRRLAGLYSTIDRLEEGIMILGSDGRMVFFNDTLERLYGLEPMHTEKKKKRKKRARRLRSEICDKPLWQAVDDAGQQGTSLQITYQQQAKPHKMLTVRVYPMPKQSDALLVVFRDITQEHKLENHRREFVANVGHELRTPLAAINGYVETLLDDGLDDPKMAEKFLKVVYRHALRLDALISDLLTLSKLDASEKSEQQLDEIDLVSLMERPVEVTLMPAHERGIEVQVDLPDNFPMAYGIQQGLEQVFINLISNAIRHSEEQSQILINGEIQDDKVILSVRDQGMGIAKEHHGRIFERFYRVDTGRSRDAGGTGLGLSIVKHIVQNCGGKVWVESEPGEGSTFFVQLRRVGIPVEGDSYAEEVAQTENVGSNSQLTEGGPTEIEPTDSGKTDKIGSKNLHAPPAAPPADSSPVRDMPEK